MEATAQADRVVGQSSDIIHVDEKQHMHVEAEEEVEGYENSSFIPIPKKSNGVWFRLSRVGTTTHMLMCSLDPDTGKKVELATGYSWKK